MVFIIPLVINIISCLGSSIYYNNHFSVSNNPPSVYGLFYCAGTEQSLLDCPRSSPNSLLYCSINKVAGVQCVGK